MQNIASLKYSLYLCPINHNRAGGNSHNSATLTMATNTENNVIERVTTGNEVLDKKIGEALHVIVQGLVPRKLLLRYEEDCDLSYSELKTVADMLGLSLCGGKVGLYDEYGDFYSFDTPKSEKWEEDYAHYLNEVFCSEQQIEEEAYEDEKELEELKDELDWQKGVVKELERVGESLEQAWRKLQDYNWDYYFDEMYCRINKVCEHFDVAYGDSFSFRLGDYTFFGDKHYFNRRKLDLWVYESEEYSSLTPDEAITIIDEFTSSCKP